MKWLGIMLMAALLASAPGYASAQPAGKKEPSAATQPQGSAVKAEPAGPAKSSTPEGRKAYEKKTAEELEAIQQKIAELRVKANTGAPQKKRMIIRAANNLQIQRLTAQNELTALEKASETAWGQEKANLDKAMEDLRKSWEAAAVHLK